MVRNSLITICALSFIVGLSQTARACECSLDSESVEGVFAGANVVFTGRVVKVTSVKMATVGLVSPSFSVWKKFEDEMQSVTLEATEAFKGVSGETIEVTTNAYSAGSCGVQFIEGENYLVYGYKRRPWLSADEARRPKENWTQELQVKADADKFNEGRLMLLTSICSMTAHLRFREEEVKKLRQIIKGQPTHDGERKQIVKPPCLMPRAKPDDGMHPTASQCASHR